MEKFKFVCALLLCVSMVYSSELEAFIKYRIKPDVIDDAPSRILGVQYSNTLQQIELGNIVTPANTSSQPEITYNWEPNAYYTLIMTDPDVPSSTNPTDREFIHWLVTNIQGANSFQGEVLTGYVGPAPRKNTGLHRYVFLLYKQPALLTFHEELKGSNNGNRKKFCTKSFAEKYKLADPIAGNFFQAQYDESVNEVLFHMGLARSHGGLRQGRSHGESRHARGHGESRQARSHGGNRKGRSHGGAKASP